MHNAFAQTPADFRHNPVYTPERETVAQFWDTPTPQSGWASDVEQSYLALLNNPSSTAAEVVAFGQQHGGTINPDDVTKFKVWQAKYHGNKDHPEYVTPPKVLTDPGDGMSGAIARGIGDGVLPNFLDEAGAVVDTLGGTQNRENIWNSDRRLADIWANNQQQNEAITGFDELAHPYARLGGELAGGLALPMGKVTSAADLAKFGAGYGFASGFGRGDGLSDRLTSGVIGAGEGAALTVVGGKLLEAAAPAAGRAWSKVTGRERAVTAPAHVNASTGLPEGIPPPPEGFTVVPHEAAGAPAAMPMAGEPGAAITAEVPRPIAGQTQRIDQPLSEAQLNARAADMQPGDVLPIPSNVVGSPEEAAAIDKGRIVQATVPHESSELMRRTVTGWNGEPVSKVGPTDLVGWLRLNGGLRDQGGELAHMGLNNAARRGMDHVGQETRFGPLVHDGGMNFDDAAEKAWEAGYFPESADRPDVNTFLNAVRGTHEGWKRAFHPDDFAELDRFNAARDDRVALLAEQGNNDGNPVYRDTSVAAGPDTPFPPVSAYQEWPAGGPDFAGNINLGKLESPQDIKRALDTTQRQVGRFDAATRGRVTHAETEALAADLGMTPDTLIARRKGQAFNAEEALAARQILAKSGNELVNAARSLKNLGDNPGDEALAEFRRKWLRHVSIQEQVSGATAEAGRALSQFRMTADSRAIRGEVLSAMVSGGGGAERIRNAADLLLDAVESGPGQFNALAEKMTKPRFRDKWRELYYNMLLSRPTTHIVNVVSNTMTALGQIPEHIVAAGVGSVRAAVGRGEDRIVGSEIGARTFGLVQGFKEGFAEFANTARTGQVRDHVSKIEGQDEFAIGGKLGKLIRTPTRLLAAEDELFKAVARRMELNGLAVRQARKEGLEGKSAAERIAELVSNPPDDMLERTMDYGRYLTFQRPLDGIASGIQQAKEKSTIGTLLVPFVRTPTNILKFAVERSPAAPFIKEWRKDFRAGGARRDLAIARVLVGSGMGAAVYQAALQGHITGSPASDPAKAQFERADGWQPYSLRIGDKFFSFSRLDPFATTIGVAADMATKREGMTSRQADDYALLLTTSIIKNMGDKTWLSGASDFIRAITDPERYGKSYLRKMVAGLVTPALSAGVAQSVDPVVRDVRSVPDALRARIPGMSSALPARRDIWGEPMQREGGAASTFLSPVWQSTRRNDPVNREMLAIGARFNDPERFVGKGDARVDLTPAQYERLSEVAGRGTRKAIEGLMASPEWEAMPRADKVAAVRQAASDAKAEARLTVMGARRGIPVPPLPSGYQLSRGR